MKYSIAILLVTLHISVFASDSLKTSVSDTLKNRKELVYYCLQMEMDAGFEVEEQNYKLLDSILSLAEKRINPKDTVAKDYPKNIMKEIHNILDDVGIIGDYDQSDPYKNLLSYSLKTRKFDCDKFSFVFLAIAERLNLPMHGVLLPSHMAVEWADKKRRFYWETTDKSEHSRDTYISQFSLNKYHFTNKMYLSRMSQEDMKLCFLYNRGLTFFMLDKYEEAEKDLDSAKTLRGIYPFIYDMKLICKSRKVIRHANIELLLDPTNDSLRIQRAVALLDLKGSFNNNRALEDMEYILRLHPDNNDAHLWRGVAYMNNFILN